MHHRSISLSPADFLSTPRLGLALGNDDYHTDTNDIKLGTKEEEGQSFSERHSMAKIESSNIWAPFRRFFPGYKPEEIQISSTQLHKMPRPRQAGTPNTIEETKHKKEYEDMVKSYEEKEKRKQQQELEQRERREKSIADCNKIWKQNNLIENWEQRKGSKKTKELIAKGIPPNIRGVVWPLQVGNHLQITPELFEIYVAQAQRAREMNGTSNEIGKEASLKVIEMDLPRTFPALSFFNEDGPLHPQLRKVLEAFTCYRPDIGYVQGMSFIASMFLLVMDTFDSFRCLSNILSRPLFLGFFRLDINSIDEFVDIFQYVLSLYLPNLYAYLMENGITAHIYAMDWILTLFSKTLPLDQASRVWDCFFLGGEYVLFKVGLALLELSENEILTTTYEGGMALLTHFPAYDEEQLFQVVKAVPAYKNDKKLQTYLQQISP